MKLDHLAAESSTAATAHQLSAIKHDHEAARHERALTDEPSVTTTAPDRVLLQILAGFNLFALAGAVGLATGQLVAELTSSWWAVVPASVVPAAAVFWLLTTLGPLHWGPRAHAAVWVVVALVALISSPPVGLLILTGIIISTWGRRLVRRSAGRPDSMFERLRLPILVAVLYTVVGIGYHAMPPVSFDGVVVGTASGTIIGGSLERSGGGVQLIACTPLADATSSGAYIHEVDAKQIVTIRSGEQASLDSGKRPSLAALALNLVGVDWPRALVLPNLRARRPTCAGAPPARLSLGHEDPALGAGAIVGPVPAGGRAANGEPPIEQTADPRIARLARRYQPTVELTVADRFWPVSVGAALADLGPGGDRTCMVSSATSRCVPIQSVPAGGQPTDYLRFPTSRNPLASALSQNPASQFRAFEAGQHTTTGPLHHWLADPGILGPWRSAQVYFYYAGPVHFGGIAGTLPSWPGVAVAPTPQDASNASDGLIGLQYWFFYPYNYYPLLVRGSLMAGAPIAADARNVDLHQGDWEHVTVLLDQRTLRPMWLYLARHDDEGAFLRWTSPLLAHDHGHPIVQAALGGHPSYPNRCGRYTRRKHGGGVLSDFVVCGSGRFAFPAASTPLVDLASAQTPWACWRGHFGEAKPGREVSAPNADTLTKVNNSFVHVAGPRAPLEQAENGSATGHGVCHRGAAAAENDALHGEVGSLLTRLFGG